MATLGSVKKARKQRAKKPDSKDETIRMRVTMEQKEAIEGAAKRDGLEVSQWLRQLALRAAGHLPTP
jgi:uncharacterized protein (DUF1778 family)